MNSPGESFEFDSYTVSEDKLTISFHYKASLKNGETFDFTEKIILPLPIPQDLPNELLKSVLETVHMALGLSYWKIFCPSKISIKSFTLSKDQAAFWQIVYTKGLGEFFYRNNIDFRNLVHLPFEDKVTTSVPLARSKRALVGFGGGKDSLVSFELLKNIPYPLSLYILETQHSYPLLEELVKQTNTDSLKIKRELDPKLFSLNKRSDSYNGHIPVSVIYAFTALLGAVLYDYQYIVFSNERSADSGNTTYLGETINHQWSKTSECENLIRNYINDITPDITYFSLLRPFSELKIAKLFSPDKKYFHYFSSCNKNFTVLSLKSENRWCRECPKCAFSFALFAAFLTKDELLEIFGENLYDKASLIPLYKDLLGFGKMKPFDCVGTFEETQAAFFLSYEKADYNHSPVMQMFVSEILPKIKDQKDSIIEEVLFDDPPSHIPAQFKNIFHSHET